jgi:hypothetical protein
LLGETPEVFKRKLVQFANQGEIVQPWFVRAGVNKRVSAAEEVCISDRKLARELRRMFSRLAGIP